MSVCFLGVPLLNHINNKNISNDHSFYIFFVRFKSVVVSSLKFYQYSRVLIICKKCKYLILNFR